MSAVEKLLTPQEYLEIERASPIKHEFHAGRMYAMAGASRNHNRITLNTAAVLLSGLGDGPGEAYSSDMRVKLSDPGAYAYPDVVVACGPQEFEDDRQDTLLNPRVIIEVLSPSTEAYDRGKKFRQYQELASLQDYVLISQDDYVVEHLSRGEDGRWTLTDAHGLDATLSLPSVGCQLELRRIYARVELLPVDHTGTGLGSMRPVYPDTTP
jgi:Uma2 family endonuclease